MKVKGWAAVLAAAALVASMGVPVAHAAKKKPKGPTTVGTDDAGDWGCNQDCSVAPLGDALGQDLIEAAFEIPDKETVNFIIKVNSLPAPGGMPEITRYTWDFGVDGDAFQLSGGFTEYVRGVCNPTTANTCPPPRDPGEAPFFLRQGPCTIGTGGIDCTEVALLHADFDADTATITVPVPLDVLNAKPGSKITPGAGSFGAAIYSAPGVFVTTQALPHDILTVTKTFTIPKGKKKKKK